MRKTVPQNMKSSSPIPLSPDRRDPLEAFAFIIAVCVCVALSACFGSKAVVRPRQSGPVVLDEQVNPNSASPASLVRLPGIGIGRANAIVAFRESNAAQTGTTVVFQNSSSLQKVSGIGPKTVQRIQRWLRFEER